MERRGKVLILKIDYRTACSQGWSFYGENAQTFMDKEKALNHANSLKSPDYETGIVKGIACGFVMWSVGTRGLS